MRVKSYSVALLALVLVALALIPAGAFAQSVPDPGISCVTPAPVSGSSVAPTTGSSSDLFLSTPLSAGWGIQPGLSWVFARWLTSFSNSPAFLKPTALNRVVRR